MGKTVITNGVFDILHAGHFRLLLLCRELAGSDGQVVVGIDSDEKVKIDKGSERPFFDEKMRRHYLLSLKIVNRVFTFKDNEELYRIMALNRPDFIVKGKDWMNKVVIGSDLANVVFVESNGISTTLIAHRVKSKND